MYTLKYEKSIMYVAYADIGVMLSFFVVTMNRDMRNAHGQRHSVILVVHWDVQSDRAQLLKQYHSIGRSQNNNFIIFIIFIIIIIITIIVNTQIS